MDVTVVIGTFGEQRWADLAAARAIPSAELQAPVVHVHSPALHSYGASIAACRNQAAAQAETEWLCFLDADDELLPGFFDAMDAATADLRTPAVSYVRPGCEPDAPMFWPDCDLRDSNNLIVTTLIRRQMFLDVGAFRDVPLYEDWDLWQRAWKAGATIERVPGAICRVHIDRRSKHRRGTTRQQKQAAHETVRRLNFPELYETAA